jgi:hypothetical protein
MRQGGICAFREMMIGHAGELANHHREKKGDGKKPPPARDFLRS